MEIKQLHELLSSVYPAAYWEFPEGKAPKMPFITYFENGSDSFGADNKVYFSGKRISVELLTKAKSPAAEAKLEELFSKNDIYWEKDETHLDDEDAYEVIYTLEV